MTRCGPLIILRQCWLRQFPPPCCLSMPIFPLLPCCHCLASFNLCSQLIVVRGELEGTVCPSSKMSCRHVLPALFFVSWLPEPLAASPQAKQTGCALIPDTIWSLWFISDKSEQKFKSYNLSYLSVIIGAWVVFIFWSTKYLPSQQYTSKRIY